MRFPSPLGNLGRSVARVGSFFNMTIAALVAISLVCQIVFVSIVFPRNLLGVAQHAMVAQADQAGDHLALHKRYVLVNYVIATLGLACLLFCATLYFTGAMTVTGLLLSIGIVFLVQVSPLAILFYHGVLPVKQNPTGHLGNLESSGRVPGLFKILPLVPVLIAAGLYLSYVLTVGVLWIRTGGNQIPKIVSITVTNFICVIAVLWSYRRLLKETNERAERYMELIRMGPIIIFGSILVTIYFFAKEVLFTLDLHEARPIMMSGALQLVAVAVFQVLCGGRSNRTMR
jgi:hypothetical protein